MPLVLAFHGGGGDAAFMADDTQYGLQRQADQGGFIVAFPNGASRLPGGRLATWNALGAARPLYRQPAACAAGAGGLVRCLQELCGWRPGPALRDGHRRPFVAGCRPGPAGQGIGIDRAGREWGDMAVLRQPGATSWQRVPITDAKTPACAAGVYSGCFSVRAGRRCRRCRSAR